MPRYYSERAAGNAPRKRRRRRRKPIPGLRSSMELYHKRHPASRSWTGKT
jgi:hypothetical protein